jgi:hypothetical protein
VSTGLGRRRAHANVQYVTSSDDKASKIRRGISPAIFSRTVENDVHVTVTVDHFAAVFRIVFEFDGYIAVHFLYEKVQRFS